jgi:hypothetical protein
MSTGLRKGKDCSVRCVQLASVSHRPCAAVQNVNLDGVFIRVLGLPHKIKLIKPTNIPMGVQMQICFASHMSNNKILCTHEKLTLR